MPAEEHEEKTIAKVTTLTVRDLMDALRDADPDASVLVQTPSDGDLFIGKAQDDGTYVVLGLVR